MWDSYSHMDVWCRLKYLLLTSSCCSRMIRASLWSFISSAKYVQIFGFWRFGAPQVLLCTSFGAMNQTHEERLIFEVRYLNLGVYMWTRYVSLHFCCAWGASQCNQGCPEFYSAHSKVDWAQQSLWSLQNTAYLCAAI